MQGQRQPALGPPAPSSPPPAAATDLPPAAVCAAFFAGPVVATPIEAGHVNRTFRVEAAGKRFILQQLAPIFRPEVNLDIAAMTGHLRRAGVATFELLPTRDGRAWYDSEHDGAWRLLTHLAGQTLHEAQKPVTAAAAAALLARFHRALFAVEHTFAAPSLNLHDLDRHLRALAAARIRHSHHPAADRVARSADEVLGLLSRLGPHALGEHVLGHGDPKLSNFLFASPSEATAVVDLDTIGPLPLGLELGDALRSWSQPLAANGQAAFSLPHFAAACTGYAACAGSLPLSNLSLAHCTQRIALELTARFLCDALEESYFGWDRRAFATSSAQQLARAEVQLAFARSLARQFHEAEDAGDAACLGAARRR